jgi:hypothetical protein
VVKTIFRVMVVKSEAIEPLAATTVLPLAGSQSKSILAREKQNKVLAV